MEVVALPLCGVKLFNPKTFQDDRGFFRESYREDLYAAHGVEGPFVQDNHSYSVGGVLRGMHFQPEQAKLISVIEGAIFDVVVDVRKGSPTFGQWEGVVLDAESGDQLYIPPGYAHGFYVTSDRAHVVYKVSCYYDPAKERSFRFDDPDVGIVWPMQRPPLLSVRDARAASFSEATFS